MYFCFCWSTRDDMNCPRIPIAKWFTYVCRVTSWIVSWWRPIMWKMSSTSIGQDQLGPHNSCYSCWGSGFSCRAINLSSTFLYTIMHVQILTIIWILYRCIKLFFARKASATYIENKGTVQTFLTERTLVNNEMTTRSLPLLFPFFLRNCRHRIVASDLQHAIHHLSNSRSGHPTLISCRRYSIREHSHRLPRIGPTSADNHQPRRAEPLPRSGETTASNNSKEEDTYHHKTVAAVERTVEETPRR